MGIIGIHGRDAAGIPVASFSFCISRSPLTSAAVIERYTRPEMAAVWADQRKYEIWLEIETLACEAQAEIGVVPKEDAETIRAKARFDLNEIAEIESPHQCDVIAFLENVASYVGPACRWIAPGHDVQRHSGHHPRRANERVLR